MPVTRSVPTWLIAALALLAAAGAWRWRAIHAGYSSAVVIAGGDGGGLPRAEPSTEGFDALALQAAATLADAQHASVLLVMRHGHLVFERYAGGVDAGTLVDGGELAHTLLMLAAGVAVAQNGMVMPALPPYDAGHLAAAIADASGLSFPLFLSRNVWQPLNAAPARWLAPMLRARASDWLRVGELLLHDGQFEGTQIVPATWVRRLARPLTAPGAEPFAAADVLTLRGPGATRLWLVPQRDLAILRVAAAPPPATAVDETRLANVIIRALSDRPATGGVSLNDLVPGH